MENYIIKDTEVFNKLLNGTLRYQDFPIYAENIYTVPHRVNIEMCSNYGIMVCRGETSTVNIIIAKETISDTTLLKLGERKLNIPVVMQCESEVTTEDVFRQDRHLRYNSKLG